MCGDGFLDSDLGEQCDDGNNDMGDECDSYCMIEPDAGCGNGVCDEGEDCRSCASDCNKACSDRCDNDADGKTDREDLGCYKCPLCAWEALQNGSLPPDGGADSYDPTITKEDSSCETAFSLNASLLSSTLLAAGGAEAEEYGKNCTKSGGRYEDCICKCRLGKAPFPNGYCPNRCQLSDDEDRIAWCEPDSSKKPASVTEGEVCGTRCCYEEDNQERVAAVECSTGYCDLTKGPEEGGECQCRTGERLIDGVCTGCDDGQFLMEDGKCVPMTCPAIEGLDRGGIAQWCTSQCEDAYDGKEKQKCRGYCVCQCDPAFETGDEQNECYDTCMDGSECGNAETYDKAVCCRGNCVRRNCPVARDLSVSTDISLSLTRALATLLIQSTIRI